MVFFYLPSYICIKTKASYTCSGGNILTFFAYAFKGMEAIGIVATLMILASMLFPTLSYKGSVCMRSLNLVGSAVFVVYGSILPAISTAVLNGALIIVNTYHLVKLILDHKKEIAKNDSAAKE